eukprot:TRINITY_DN49970_c0_g1_i1.p1 TRINITY_DN49970_c0_g1~~TRINITY_DN49970_c0_g1_i1.p1  ORF type:complete len:209 (-),score=24.47 TRINITY_DN49970_c0_g1_i1:9-635(-)
MGCCGSSEKMNILKTQLAMQDFSSSQGKQGLVYDFAEISGELRLNPISKKEASIEVGDQVVLRMVESKTAVSFDEPTSGESVVLIWGPDLHPLTLSWEVWSAKSNGGQPAPAPNGQSMYKWGSFTKSTMSNFDPVKYVDAAGSPVLSAILQSQMSYACAIYGPDGSTPAATLEGMTMNKLNRGLLTFAKGVDPIMALASARAAVETCS